ncbi:MAG: hypothetical protein IPM52_04015 [Bacteroidetes bacterium]|nr:hypothetical protein [Bacteroidota bacterium]
MKRILHFLLALTSVLLIRLSPVLAQQPQTFEQTMKSAEERFAQKDYLSAKTYYELALRLKPGDATATRRLNETIVLIQKQMEEQEVFYKHMDEGDKLLAAGKEEEALIAYRKALKVFPNDRYVNSQVEKITRKQEEARQKQQSFDQAMQRGNLFLNDGRYEEAILQFTIATELFPTDSEAKSKLQLADQKLAELRANETRFQQLMTEARSQMVRRNYAEAQKLSADALNLFPQHQEAKSLNAEAERMLDISTRYEAAIVLADQAYEAKRLDEAKRLYAEAQKIWPEQGFAADMIKRINETLDSPEYRNEVLVTELLKEAASAYERQNLRLALEKYNKVLEINPEHELASQRTTEITFALRQQQKQAEDQATFERLLAEGVAKEKSDDFTSAAAAFEKALEIKPGDATAQSGLERVRARIAEINAAREADQRFADLLAQGRNLFTSNELDQALEKLNEALALKPGNQEALAEKTKIETLKREAEAKNELETRYANLLRQADEAFAKADYKTAELAYTEASVLKPSESYPRERARAAQESLARLLAEAAQNEQYATIIAEADNAYRQQDFDKASALYTQALDIRPNEDYPKTQLSRISELQQSLTQKRETEQRIQSLMNQGNEYLKNRQWVQAISTFEQVLTLDPDNIQAPARKAEAMLAMDNERKEAQQRYEQSVAEGDRQMGLNNYQEAIAAFKMALGYKPADDYATKRISQAEAIILERLANQRNEYNRIVTEADRNFNARNYDKAIELYLSAENTKPDEAYPRQMIGRIAEIFEKNKVRDLVTTSFTLDANTNRRLTFEPLEVADRRSSYVIVKARNLGKGNFPLLVQFGSNNARNGGFVLPIPDNEETNDFIVHIGAQYRWFSEDNNWLEFIPENGNVEISLVRISKQ